MLKTVTGTLILINLILYVFTLLVPNLMYNIFALHTFGSQYYFMFQLITYQFIHDTGPLHILFNMMILYVFGSIVEKKYGPSKMLWFYLFSGVVAGILHNLTISDEKLFFSMIRNQQLTLVGASGAIWGIMTLFTFLYPNEKLYLFFVLGVKTKFIIPIFFAIEVLSAIASSDNISHFAHIGGAIAGLILFFLDYKKIIK